MNIARYNKAIIAALWAVILIVQLAWPGSPVEGVTQEQVINWWTIVSAGIGPILVYLIPNKG